MHLKLPQQKIISKQNGIYNHMNTFDKNMEKIFDVTPVDPVDPVKPLVPIENNPVDKLDF